MTNPRNLLTSPKPSTEDMSNLPMSLRKIWDLAKTFEEEGYDEVYVDSRNHPQEVPSDNDGYQKYVPGDASVQITAWKRRK